MCRPVARQTSVLLFVVLFGCTWKSPHEVFVEDMQTYVGYDVTIERLDELSSGYGLVDSGYLTDVETLNDGNLRYHYAHPNIWGRHCHYYFVVDGRTRKVIGWGFDYDKSDPTRECGRSG